MSKKPMTFKEYKKLNLSQISDEILSFPCMSIFSIISALNNEVNVRHKNIIIKIIL